MAHLVRTLGVVGAGQMGMGIAFVAARTAGVNVLVTDTSQAQLDKGFKLVDQLLAKDVSRSKLTQTDADAIRGRIRGVTALEELTECEFAIEAVSESLPLKQKIFAQLATHLGPTAILASNTSSISLTAIAAAAVSAAEGAKGWNEVSPSRVIGVHFFNPVPVMRLVEIIPALQTSTETVERARAFVEAMGKEVTVSRDSPGFISNRLLMPYINEAIQVLEEGVATKEDIDKTMKLGMAHPMGPLQLADFIGLDTCLAIQEVLHSQTGDSKYRPAGLLRRMVLAGWLGKKSGKGFFDY